MAGRKIVVEHYCFLPDEVAFVCEHDCSHHGSVCKWLKVKRFVAE